MPKFKKPIIIYLVNIPKGKADKKSMAYQYAVGLILVLLGILLALPLVPGPGLVFLILGLIVLRVPGSEKLVSYLNRKEFFKHFKLWLKLKLNIKLVTSLDQS